MDRPPVVCLIILDGFGYREETAGNAIAAAATPTFDRIWREYPHTLLQASGRAVGLPTGMMGNSETGHMNMGAGRIVLQKLTQISRRIEDGTFFDNPALAGAIAHARERGTRLHLLGLIGPGGVHAYDEHLLAILHLARSKGLDEVFVQAILDGRDTPPQSAEGYIEKLNREMAGLPAGTIATVSGRYYAMDRDKRWDRTAAAYQAMVAGEGPRADSPEGAISAAYAAGTTDEFIMPTVITRDGQPVATIGDGDAVIFFNFRGDRPRQLTRAFVQPDFSGFDRGEPLRDLYFVTLAEYEKGVPVVVAFPPEALADPIEISLAEVVSNLGMRQLHVAETEKYAHVTYFINGGHEEPFPGEDRVLVPSQKVATYDLAPEMSAAGVAQAVIDRLVDDAPPALVIMNFANCDMVGHSGMLEPTIRAVETVDQCLGRVLAAVEAAGGVAIVTADHGNAEMMVDPETGSPHTAHTTNPVPCVLVAPDTLPALRQVALRDGGVLGDISPTILVLLGAPQPAAMKARSLLADYEPSR
ncbi:MAG TPA: 2,3-bisphosphoglycerate-independent phosphoglycerate mutase [Chloroflexota bacterium]|nr:2,3-bisphosphoglycerate-independent phosphoglycerate mutase [Chloroflexota bacterium]